MNTLIAKSFHTVQHAGIAGELRCLMVADLLSNVTLLFSEREEGRDTKKKVV